MRMLLVVVACAAAGYFFYKRNHEQPPEADTVTVDKDKTPGANAKNRVDNLSGSVDVDP